MAIDSHSDDLDPDAVGRREFTRSRRGFDQIEVRAFLNTVAAQLRTERQRQVELTRKLADAESREARGRASDAQRMTTVLGEETARIIEAAREAAQEMRERAEIETTKARDKAAGVLTEAEQTAQDTMEQAQADAVAARDQATTEAMAEVERAKDRAREMVEEARTHRERVMHDVARRRKALRSQYQTLAGVRDQMLERLDASQGLLGGAIDEVRRALNDDVQLVHTSQDHVIDHEDQRDDAELAALDEDRVFHRVRTPAPPVADDLDEDQPADADETGTDGAADLGPVADQPAADEVGDGETAVIDEPTADEEPDADEPAIDEPVNGEASIDEPRDDDPAESGEVAVGDVEVVAEEASDDEAPVDADEAEGESEDVDLLFAKLRAGSFGDETETPDEAEPAEAAADGDSDESIDLRGDAAQTEDGEDDEPPLLDPGADPFGARDQVLEPVDRMLQRQLKRVLADDQNGVLDRLRTVRGRPTPQRILADLDDVADAAAEASAEILAEAYRAGAMHIEGPQADAADAAALLRPVFESSIAEPLRSGVAALLDASDDVDELSEHVRAAYRTFRTEQLPDVSAHLVAAAYARGRYDGIDADVDVVWLQDPEASSPDCEDNELAGVVTKGTVFPTGAECAPAYAGCRCLVIPSALAPTPTEA